jgi:hypothetical protein
LWVHSSQVSLSSLPLIYKSWFLLSFCIFSFQDTLRILYSLLVDRPFLSFVPIIASLVFIVLVDV